VVSIADRRAGGSILAHDDVAVGGPVSLAGDLLLVFVVMRRITMLAVLALGASCEKTQPEPRPLTADQIDPAKNPWNADKLRDASAGAATAAGGEAVRPPVAADLVAYTKDLPGSGKKLFAKLETSRGVIDCELFPDTAPMTVANFVGLATGKKPWTDPTTNEVVHGKPFFDGLTFHRVIAEFMIQGGDPLGTGTGGPGYQFGDELGPAVKMQPGTLAMANSGPATNGSQFFITEIAPSWLDGKHTIFGTCKQLDIVKQIARVPQNAQNKPDTPITMKITIHKG